MSVSQITGLPDAQDPQLPQDLINVTTTASPMDTPLTPLPTDVMCPAASCP